MTQYHHQSEWNSDTWSWLFDTGITRKESKICLSRCCPTKDKQLHSMTFFTDSKCLVFIFPDCNWGRFVHMANDRFAPLGKDFQPTLPSPKLVLWSSPDSKPFWDLSEKVITFWDRHSFRISSHSHVRKADFETTQPQRELSNSNPLFWNL
jgi:hypothetical protein